MKGKVEIDAIIMPARLWLLLLEADLISLHSFYLSVSIFMRLPLFFLPPIECLKKKREKRYRKSSSLAARKRMFSPLLNVLREELTLSSSLIKTGHLYKPCPPVSLFDHTARCSHPAMFTHGDRWRPSSQPSYQNEGLRRQGITCHGNICVSSP